MEQIYDTMLLLAQAAAQRQTSVSTAEQSGETQSGSFQKMLESQRAAQSGDGTSARADASAGETETAQAAQAPEAVQDDSDLELEKQMAWAALAVMQNPAVPMEQIAAPAEQVADPAARNADSAVQTVQAVVPVEPAAEPAAQMEEPMARTAVQAAPEDSAQTFDSAAPLTARAAETGKAAQEPQPEPLTADAGAEAPVRTQEQPVQQVQAAEPAQEDAVVEDQPAAAEKTGYSEAAPETEKPEQNVEYAGETPVFQEVHEIPVKVGEAEAPAQTAESEPVETQVSGGLIQALRGGETKVELQLEPENLGSVQVEMTWDKQGVLHVSLYAQSSHTRNLLERDMTGLQALLSRDTQQEVRVEVPRQEESQQQNLYDGRDGREQQENQQRERQQQNHPQSGEDFLQQLRLGLISLDGEAS